MTPTYVDVLVVGGGNAGLGAAARLRRRGVRDITIVEPGRTHTYRPLLNYVGAGEASLPAAQRSQDRVTPRGCQWLCDTVDAIDPSAHRVRCASGTVLEYRDLVLATGIEPDHAALPGIGAALATPAVVSNYLDDATRTWAATRAVPEGGRAVFTIGPPPVSCTGTTLKPLFLAVAYWCRQRPRVRVDVTLVVDRPTITGVYELDSQLVRHLDHAGVEIRWSTSVTSVSPDRRTVRVRDRDGAETELGYDMLHLVPPFRGARIVSGAGLATSDRAALVDVDPTTLRHHRFGDVWALGDGAALMTDPSGGALRKQAPVLARNIVAARAGAQLSTYGGYTVAPVTIDRSHLILGEFDRTLTPTTSLPRVTRPLTPRRISRAFDRHVLPQIYWRLILRGLA